MAEVDVRETRGSLLSAREVRVFAPLLAVVVGAVGTALVIQYGFGIRPCELCLLQRPAYYLAAVLCALPLASRLVGFPKVIVSDVAAVVALVMAVNAGLGVYHAGVEWHFWAGPSTCTGTAVDLGGGGDLLSRLDSAVVVRCDEPAFRVLGLSMAGMNAILSAALAASAGVASFRLRRGGWPA